MFITLKYYSGRTPEINKSLVSETNVAVAVNNNNEVVQNQKN